MSSEAGVCNWFYPKLHISVLVRYIHCLIVCRPHRHLTMKVGPGISQSRVFSGKFIFVLASFGRTAIAAACV